MSSPRVLETSLFPLDDETEVEVVFVQLEDGRIVARTPDELGEGVARTGVLEEPEPL